MNKQNVIDELKILDAKKEEFGLLIFNDLKAMATEVSTIRLAIKTRHPECSEKDIVNAEWSILSNYRRDFRTWYRFFTHIVDDVASMSKIIGCEFDGSENIYIEYEPINNTTGYDSYDEEYFIDIFDDELRLKYQNLWTLDVENQIINDMEERRIEQEEIDRRDYERYKELKEKFEK